jgi:hypothetical protein
VPVGNLTKLPVKRRLVWAGLMLAAAAAAIVIYGGAFATRAYLEQASSRGQSTLRLAVAVLRGQMNRYQSLPALIADHDDIKELLADPFHNRLRANANVYLKETNVLLKPVYESLGISRKMLYGKMHKTASTGATTANPARPPAEPQTRSGAMGGIAHMLLHQCYGFHTFSKFKCERTCRDCIRLARLV